MDRVARTQARLEVRWNEILERGSDPELTRLTKELSDRVYGRTNANVQTEEGSILPNGGHRHLANSLPRRQ